MSRKQYTKRELKLAIGKILKEHGFRRSKKIGTITQNGKTKPVFSEGYKIYGYSYYGSQHAVESIYWRKQYIDDKGNLKECSDEERLEKINQIYKVLIENGFNYHVQLADWPDSYWIILFPKGRTLLS